SGSSLITPVFSSDSRLVFYRSDAGAADDDLQLYVRDVSRPSAPQRVNATLLLGSDVSPRVIPVQEGLRVVYVASEASPSEDQVFLCTLNDPTDSASFSYLQLNSTVAGTRVKRIKVWEQ
ncbi:MAG: hypothetical protein KDD82_02445, partial [Planctomycetes bacterium]|nr:hypothetical protein [Planctomycetota bacterium]